MSRRVANILLSLSFLLPLCNTAAAFQLSPTGTLIERQRASLNLPWYQRFQLSVAERGVHQFAHPVHEEITHRIYGCMVESACQNPDSEYAPPTVIAGVRWNDDPPFRLSASSIRECRLPETVRVITQPVCWYKLFKDAEQKSQASFFDADNSGGNLMYRSHFGDLQFLHAMAAQDGEAAGVTRERILMWGEFTWAVASGTYGGAQRLADVSVPGFSAFFGKVGWTVQDLFSLGNPALRRNLPDLAFGSLLHLVEDSFAQGHVERRDPVAGAQCPAGQAQPGRVLSFHSYVHQDHQKHADYDSPDALLQGLLDPGVNVVVVGQALKAMYEAQKPWPEVRSYLECIFALDDPGAQAAAGAGFVVE